MRRGFFVLFALLSYAIFLATFLYLIAFVGDLLGVPRTVDVGPETAVAIALPVDVALIALFGIQHSVMARPGFKAMWTRVVPPPLERSIYMLAASAVLILLFALWQPIDGDVWRVDSQAAAAPIWAVFAAGWLIVLLSTFLINHFELFGLQQAIQHWQGSRPAAPRFRQPLFYKLVRHPLYSGFFLAFWATPQMSMGHLLLAVGMSVYMLVAIRYEERDLVDLFGADYERYRAEVGMLTPRLGSRPH